MSPLGRWEKYKTCDQCLRGLCKLLLLLATFLVPACSNLLGPKESEPPSYYDVVHLYGSPYERGFQHGQLQGDRIRSFYTRMLSSSILPWLNREKPTLDSYLIEYKNPIYDNGRFSYQLLLQSGQNLETYMPQAYIDEMRGISDGADIPYDKILLLNTMMDSILALRAVTYMINLIQAPKLSLVEISEGLAYDDEDNDGDGDIDEAGEGLLYPYKPSAWATFTEIPLDARIRIRLQDLAGVDPKTVILSLNGTDYREGSPGLDMSISGLFRERLEIDFAPPGGFPAAAKLTLQLKAGNNNRITNPPPAHAQFMREEVLVLTTSGYGKRNYDVPNEGSLDPGSQATSIGFALRNTATTDGRIIAAHHFALIDSNTSHKHTALFVHHPDNGRTFAVLGWSGFIWGFSGMNSDGLVFMANLSDTADNSMTRPLLEQIFWAKLASSGLLLGLQGREILSNYSEVDSAMEYLEVQEQTFGWNIMLVDSRGDMIVAEVDSDIKEDEDGGFHSYSADPAQPGNQDPWGRPLAGSGPDDLRMAVHYVKNTEDISLPLISVPGFELSLAEPQRGWTPYYYRSLRSFYRLGREIDKAYGSLDISKVMSIMKKPALEDQRDSMYAAIFEPQSLTIHFAMGQVPATSGPFQTIVLGTP